MPEAAAWVLVGLAAVFVGCAVPVLLQLRRTLKTAEQTLETTSRQVNLALDGLTATLGRLNRVASELESGVGRVSSLIDALGGLGDMLARIRGSFSSAATFGSVIGGALLAAFGLKGRDRVEPAPPQTEAPDPTK